MLPASPSFLPPQMGFGGSPEAMPSIHGMRKTVHQGLQCDDMMGHVFLVNCDYVDSSAFYVLYVCVCIIYIYIII